MRRHLLAVGLAVTACAPTAPNPNQTVAMVAPSVTSTNATSTTTSSTSTSTALVSPSFALPSTPPVTHLNHVTAPINHVTPAVTGGTSITNPQSNIAATFACIRARESGGNYANKRNPNYRGAYQFAWASWRAVGGTGDPADASPAEQDMRALMLYQRAGFAPWGGGCR